MFLTSEISHRDSATVSIYSHTFQSTFRNLFLLTKWKFMPTQRLLKHTSSTAYISVNHCTQRAAVNYSLSLLSLGSCYFRCALFAENVVILRPPLKRSTRFVVYVYHILYIGGLHNIVAIIVVSVSAFSPSQSAKVYAELLRRTIFIDNLRMSGHVLIHVLECDDELGVCIYESIYARV